jgi:ABC-type proline/glycine betaine transport system, ATPase component
VADTSAALGHEIDRSAAPLIRVEGVWKIFGRHADRVIGTPDADLPRAELREKHDCVAAVRDVSFDVWPSEVFVVMGLSGSGKSTLVRTLIRLIEPTAGQIEIAGKDVSGRESGRAARLAPPHVVDGLPALRAARPSPRDRQRGLRARDPGCRKVGTARAREKILRLVGLEDSPISSPTSSPAACSSASGSPARSPSSRR